MNHKKTIFLALLFLGVFGMAGRAWAAPAVSSISGTIGHGQNITIFGSGFGVKSHAAPLVWDIGTEQYVGGVNFNAYSNLSDGDSVEANRQVWGEFDAADGTVRYSTSRSQRHPRISAHYATYNESSAYLKLDVGLYENNGEYAVDHLYTPLQHRFYLSFYRKLRNGANTPGGGDGSTKFLRIDTSPWTNIGGGDFAAHGLYGGAGTQAWIAAGTETTWVRWETYVDITKQWFDVYKNGHYHQGTWSAAGGNLELRPAADWRFRLPGVSGFQFDQSIAPTASLIPALFGYDDGHQASLGQEIDLGEIYYDDTMARVEISDQPVWNDSPSSTANREVQGRLLTWNNNQITLQLYQGAFDSLSGKYLYVIDEDGGVNTNGYLLGSGGPDTTPPVISSGQPSGVLAYGTTSTTLSVATNENATCRYSTTANTSYSLMTLAFTTTGATSHSTTISGLSNGATYNRYVRCRDTIGNANASDYVITFSVASSGPPANVFSNGFEDGDLSVWDDYDGNPAPENLVILDSGPFNTSGNHVMRLRVPPGRGGADLVKVLPAQYDKLYLRWYQKYENGFNFAAPGHGSGFHAGSRDFLGSSDNRPLGNDFMGSWLESGGTALNNQRFNLYTYYRGMYMDCANPVGQCWGDHLPCWYDDGSNYCTKAEHRDQPGRLPPLLQDDRWYCLETMVDMGTPVQSDALADGVQDFWIDGVEYGPFEHLWHRTSSNLKLSILWMDLFHHDATHSVEGIMLDDIVVSTDRIGCGATPPVDTTPPVLSNGTPSGTLSYNTTSTTLSVITNENANCRYSTTAGIPYTSMTNNFTTTSGTSHSRTITGLQNGQSYNYYVKCQDLAGNANSSDYPISFSVASVPSSGSVAWWRFDEASGTTAQDSSGNSNTGTLTNGPVWTAGRINSALRFDGIDDYVTIPNSPSLDTGNAFTVTAWVMNSESASPSNNWKRIINKKSPWDSASGWEIGLVDSAIQQGRLYVNGSGGNNANLPCVANWKTTDLNRWVHIAVTFNAGAVTAYCDGANRGNGVTTAVVANTRPVQIGRIESEPNQAWNGSIDDVRIYNRILTPAEISMIYNEIDTTPPSAPTGLTIN